jgi:hypothetical protein
MSAAVENLVQRLNARRSGDSWMAKCPAHTDKNPSLSIKEGSDGRALLKCFAGCENDAILSALGMKWADLFPAPIPASIKAPAPVKSGKTEAPKVAITPRPIGGILDAVIALLRRFIVFPTPEQAEVIAVWIAHTWVLEAFDYTAYLHIFSPAKRSGKSRVLEVIEQLTKNAKRTPGATAAALMRSLDENNPPTMLLDEIDDIYGKKVDAEADNSRRFLNAGFKRGNKFLKCTGPSSDISVIELPAFCPKALAGIGRTLPDTVADRSIPIEIVRQSRKQRAERLRDREAGRIFGPVRAELEAWGQLPGVIDTLQAARPALPEELHDRLQDITEGLIAIAELAGSTWPEKIRKALVKLAGQEEDEDIGVKLLGDIKIIFVQKDAEKLTTEEILEELVSIEDRPWAAWWADDLSHGRLRVAAAGLSRALKDYRKPDGKRLKPSAIKFGKETFRGFRRADFEIEWERYLPHAPRPLIDETDETMKPSQEKTVASEVAVASNCQNAADGSQMALAEKVTSKNEVSSTPEIDETGFYPGKIAKGCEVASVSSNKDRRPVEHTQSGNLKLSQARSLLTDLLIRLNAEARQGLHPKGHPYAIWRNGYPLEYAAALHQLADYKPDEQRDSKVLNRLVYKIGAEERKGTPLQSPVREWSGGGFPAEYHAAQAYLADQAKRSSFPDMTDEEWSKYDAEFRAGKWLLTDGSPDILSGHWLHFRDAADFRAFYGEERPLPETCVGLEGSDSRSELEAVQDTLSCGCKLADESDGFFYHPGRHIARCTDCQSAEWIAQGFEVEGGFPYGDWQATTEERLAETKKREL